jgi:hypothetical protein
MKEISFRLFFYYFQQTICVKQLLRISPAAAKAKMLPEEKQLLEKSVRFARRF